MKKLFALLLITVFVSSSFVKLYKDFINYYSISVFANESEDDTEEKEIEKDTDLKKDKIIVEYSVTPILDLALTQKFYTTQSYFLPTPHLAKEIIPPNTA
jgi:hypothetical protein